MGTLRLLPALFAALLVAAMAPVAAPVEGQEAPDLRLIGPAGTVERLDVVLHRGYFALPATSLARLGWSADDEGGGVWRLRHPRGVTVSIRAGSPFVGWGSELLQLVSEPYVVGDELYLPLQLVLDVFPSRLGHAYARESAGVLRVRSDEHWTAVPEAPGPPDLPSPDTTSAVETPGDAGSEAGPAEPPDRTRVVVIDPGHGGRDPGAVGRGGVREKDVALGLGLALARELRRYPDLEIYLTRDSDVLVPLWRRGEWATEKKGDRPGIFVSLHANALPSRRAARGFETYFLSEARTEHERRVAANENAPLAIEAENGSGPGQGDLSFILKELRNLDHQHWSALLAELVQREVAPVHPGPDRGVKQGPFAVITNALMPAILVETGFITNPEEERLLARDSFQQQVARSLAAAIVEFFRRYPPGQGTDLEEGLREDR